MKRYNPKEIEPLWQKKWADSKLYEVTEDSAKPKRYVTAMFPYPSGAGLHVGHVRNYSITDAIARFQRQNGNNVLSTIGWDGFGLPAENYAIKTGTPPAVSTAQNIKNFKSQLQRLGMSYDWSRELNTTDPSYYKWTQWIFTKLFERGLAYQKESLQWWCPVDKTVLANEQVEGGKCWRCGNEVVKKSMKQWFFRITDYADELLDGIDDLDWPDKIKTMQRNWIGRSQGAEVDFDLVFDDKALQANQGPDGKPAHITVFTTRSDTLFGATFLVLAPEHPWVKLALEHGNVLTNNDAVAEYVQAATKRSEIERQMEGRDKTGVQLQGVMATNPATSATIPVWTADYVLGGYGTGAIMAVPAHDERDHAFAEKFDLPITRVVQNDAPDDACSHDEGVMINSGPYDGLSSQATREKIVSDLTKRGVAEEKVNYKMRDWLISRQRYWGAPIPIIHCSTDGAVAVPEKDLPVLLPEVEHYEPDGSGKGVLGQATDWVNTTCPKCGGPATRETDTMDGYVDSSWYLFRYADAHNDQQVWDPAKVNYWAPVDFYCGGDHAVAHLLYVRFWTQVFKQMGLTNFTEPIKRLVYNGYIYAADGTKMSKSKGNVVDPLEVIDSGYGADALRVYELFIGPYEQNNAWDAGGVAGTFRFLNRVWTLVQEYLDAADAADNTSVDALNRTIHKAIKKTTYDLEQMSFNTAIAALMECVNELYKIKKAHGYVDRKTWQTTLETLVQLLAPFAPHITEELWQQLGHDDSVHLSNWPKWDEKYLATDTMTIAVQVNGKLRGEITVATDATQDEIVAAAKAKEHVAQHIEGKELRKTIYVPGKIVNFVV
jgi:leucyl-tRNA synthetase